jgi:hypothetical protein
LKVNDLIHEKQLVKLLRVWILDFKDDYQTNYSCLNSPMPSYVKKQTWGLSKQNSPCNVPAGDGPLPIPYKESENIGKSIYSQFDKRITGNVKTSTSYDNFHLRLGPPESVPNNRNFGSFFDGDLKAPEAKGSVGDLRVQKNPMEVTFSSKNNGNGASSFNKDKFLPEEG